MTGDFQLLARIEAFNIDGGDRPAYSFAARLADENGWSRAFAERVIREYKRYVYLAMTEGRAVCPSDAVDEAWHLHLTYTRSYWVRFCGETLRGELHHDPTRGGSAEDDKHWRMYEATLVAYRAAFGETPPPDIWPPVATRFAGMVASVAAPAVEHSRLRRARALLSVSPAAAIVVVAIAAALWSQAGALNPFALQGSQFLLALVPALLLAILAGRVLHERVRLAGAPRFRRFKPLDWDEAAYAAGGSGRLSSATMARLVAGGFMRVSDDGMTLAATGKSGNLSNAERAALDHLPIAKGRSSTPLDFKRMEADIARSTRSRIAALEADGVLIAERRIFCALLASLAPLAAVLLFLATPRLAAGRAAGKPVLFLVIAMCVGAVVGLIFARPTPVNRRTPKGEELLQKMRSAHSGLEIGKGLERPVANASTDSIAVAAGLGVALFGTAALAHSEMAELTDLGRFLPARVGQSSGCGGGCGSSTSGGGGDGGGSSGCGGCGGGGGGGD